MTSAQAIPAAQYHSQLVRNESYRGFVMRCVPVLCDHVLHHRPEGLQTLPQWDLQAAAAPPMQLQAHHIYNMR